MTKKYYYSLIILLIFGFIANYYQAPNGSLVKLLINLNIYLSLLFIPWISQKGLKKHFNTKSSNIFWLIILFGAISFFRDIFKGEITSLFGNPFLGPAFLVPLFMLWGTKIDSIHWLHKISMISIKTGILLYPLYSIGIITFPFIAFAPTSFIILNYNYANRKDRIWILISLIIGSLAYWQVDYRSGILRIILSVAIFLFLQFRFKRLYKYAVWLILAVPIYGIYLSTTTGESIFTRISSYNSDSDKNMLLDTRTFLYTETINDLLVTKNIFWGKGPTGRYYSEYFDTYGGDSGDRINVEVGVLHYLLKGGIIYLLLFSLIVIFAIQNGLKKTNNNYIISLALITAVFYLYSFVENIPSYSFSFAPYWIIIGISLSSRFKTLDDTQIKALIRNKNYRI